MQDKQNPHRRRKIQALEKEKRAVAVGAKGAGAATERLQKELDKLKCVAAP